MPLHILECGSVAGAWETRARLRSTGDYAVVEPDWIVAPCGSPNDPYFARQWHLARTGASQAWALTTGMSGVTVALVDTGIEHGHPDLAASLVPGYNAVDRLAEVNGGRTEDVNGHGTETAGVAGAIGDNAAGVCGVAWELRLMPVRASNSASGAAYMGDIIDGIGWSVAYGGARVVTTGYAGVRASVVEWVGRWVVENNALLVWPAENSGDSYDGFDWPSVLVVGGTDQNDRRAATSCFGRAVDLAAPAADIYSTHRGGVYGSSSGNSFSAPQVAGALGLMLSVAPELSPRQAETALKLGCRPLEGERLGAGLLNVAESVRLGSRVDVNRDGFIDWMDYVGFVEAFETGTRTADINNDGFVDFFDYDWFIRLFEGTW
jgi:subtilisin family serine protease